MTTMKHRAKMVKAGEYLYRGFQVVNNGEDQPPWWISHSELWRGGTLKRCKEVIDRYIAEKEAEIGFGVGGIVTNGKVAGEVKSLDFASNEIVIEVETHVVHPKKIVIKLVEHHSAIFAPATMRPVWKVFSGYFQVVREQKLVFQTRNPACVHSFLSEINKIERRLYKVYQLSK